MDRNNLTFVYATPIVAENEIDELIQAAERQIKKNDKDGVDHTILQLNALIEARRQGLQDALRTLDGNYSRRRDELLYRASGSRRENRLDAVPTDDTTEPGFQVPPGLTVEPGVESVEVRARTPFGDMESLDEPSSVYFRPTRYGNGNTPTAPHRRCGARPDGGSVCQKSPGRRLPGDRL